MADAEQTKKNGTKRKHLKLYTKGTFTGYRRGLRNQYESFALLHLEGANTKEDAKHYLGKRCVFVYKGKNKTRVAGSSDSQHKNRLRAMWGKVTRIHGNSGSVRFVLLAITLALCMGDDKCSDSGIQQKIKDAIKSYPGQTIIGNNPDANFCSIGASFGEAKSAVTCSCEFYQGCAKSDINIVSIGILSATVSYGVCKIMWYDWLILAAAICIVCGLFCCLVRCLCCRKNQHYDDRYKSLPA